MKIGTFSCWLWGHKFMATDYEPRTLETKEGYEGSLCTTVRVFTHKTHYQTDHCTRCGIDKDREK